MKTDIKITKKDRDLYRKIRLEYIKQTKLKKFIKLNFIANIIGIGLHLLIAIDEYKFNIFRIIGTVFGVLILSNLFLFLIFILKTGIQWTIRSQHEQEKFNQFAKDYMNELLENNKINKEEYDRFFKLNSKVKL